MNLKTVIILGAGASRDCGGPLIADFLDRAYELILTDKCGKAKERFDNVFRAIAELRSVHEKSYLDTDNIETLFGAIEMARIIRKLGSRNEQQIEQLRDALVSLIVTTIEQTILFPVTEGRIIAPTPYWDLRAAIDKALHRGLNVSDLTVLTFNYDLAADVMLSHAGGVDYCLDGKTNGIKLLKLHGSLNWGKCSSCKEIVPIGVPLSHHGVPTG